MFLKEWKVESQQGPNFLSRFYLQRSQKDWTPNGESFPLLAMHYVNLCEMNVGCCQRLL